MNELITTIELAVLAFTTQYLSGVIGMGYGTILTPVLILLGFNPLNAISSVVLSQLIGNSILSLMHHRLGNADFSRHGVEARRALTIGLVGALGPVLAVMVMLNIPTNALKTYIAALMIVMSILTVISGKLRVRYSDRKLIVIALIASFNKGLTGGGYGPVVTTGQMILGVNPKSAVAVTSLAEFIAEVTAVTLYGLTGMLNPTLFIPMVIGTVASAPLIARTVKIVPNRTLRGAISTGMTALAIALLFRALI